MIVERATVTFEGLTLSAERAQGITRRAFGLVAAGAGDHAGRLARAAGARASRGRRRTPGR